MKAGRELDALVATEMGWTAVYAEHAYQQWEYGDPGMWEAETGRGVGIPPGGIYKRPFPRYSTSIAAAWEVVEKMCEDGDVFIENWQDGEWTVSTKPLGFRDNGVVVSALTAPHAICLAALRASGVDV